MDQPEYYVVTYRPRTDPQWHAVWCRSENRIVETTVRRDKADGIARLLNGEV